jgi:hypothetical protein
MDGSAYIAKIDYYDTDERFLSDDPEGIKDIKKLFGSSDKTGRSRPSTELATSNQ